MTDSPFFLFLSSKVEESLAKYDYKNALFLAERLFVEYPSDSSRYILATCHFRCNHISHCHDLLKGHLNTLELRYLFALCCLELGKYFDGEIALIDDQQSNNSSPTLDASSYWLLGRLSQKASRRSQAIEYYMKCVELDPFCWSAFEILCSLGVELDPSSLFSVPQSISTFQQQIHKSIDTPDNKIENLPQPLSFSTPSSVSHCFGRPPKIFGSCLFSPLTPAMKFSKGATPVSSFQTPQPISSQSFAKDMFSVNHLTTITSSTTSNQDDSVNVDFLPSQPRRSARLASHYPYKKLPQEVVQRKLQPEHHKQTNTKIYKRKSGSSTPAKIRAADVKNKLVSFPEPQLDQNEKEIQDTKDQNEILFDTQKSRSKIQPSEENEQKAAKQEIFSIFRILAKGFYYLSHYKCQEAINTFSLLPHRHYMTRWVLAQLGRCSFEMVDYSKSISYYKHAFMIEPFNIYGLEYYSTALWHMKELTELSFLAQKCIQHNKLLPQTYIILGNCFSLQKDHRLALRYFLRSIQLDPTLTYAFTLSAHEYLAIADFDKAISGYRNAIRLDDRHYNAWFGLGMIYYRQEKYLLAEYHFRNALSINSRMSVIHCYLGMSLSNMKKFEPALEVLNRAIECEPRNALAKYQKANIYLSLDKPELALKECLKIIALVPHEASVHLLLGKIYKKLGDLDNSRLEFLKYVELNPKEKNLVYSELNSEENDNIDI